MLKLSNKTIISSKTLSHIILIILIIFIEIILFYKLLIIKYQDYIRTTMSFITAHRGASNQYIENTMAAFMEAKEKDVKWIEIDVQETKDNKLVIMHDKNLQRLFNSNKKIANLKYKELQLISSDIPLLEDVIVWAKINNINLNIELKVYGNEVNFAKKVINLINKYQYKHNCYIASMNYDILKEVKKLDPMIKTLYVTNNINYPYLEDIDDYSVLYSNITPDLVKLVHLQDKKIYAWTVDDEDNIINVLDLNVDNIITNNIDLVRDTIIKQKNDFIFNLINYILN